MGNSSPSPPEMDRPKKPTSSPVENPPDTTNVTPEEEEYPPPWKVSMITIALVLVILCFSLDETIIATAIPKITDDFSSLTDIGWYASAYLLTTSACMLVSGKMYSYYPTKWLFLASFGVFELGSLVCGTATSSGMLIAGRAVAGVGGAGLFPGAILIMAQCVPLERRPAFMGAFGAVFGVSCVAGPLLGGVFTDRLSWKWCFLVNLPIGAVTAACIIFLIEARPVRVKEGDENLTWWQKIRRLDIEGTMVFIPSVVCLVLALQWGGVRYPWSNWKIILLFIVSGALGAAFFVIQAKKGDEATVPMRVIWNRDIIAASWYRVCVVSADIAIVYYLPLWFQAIKEASATRSGIMSIPLLLSIIIGAILSGALVSWTGYYTPFMILSSLIATAGAGLLTTFSPTTPASQWITYQILFGFGAGIGNQQPLIVVQTVLGDDDIAIGTAVLMFIQTLGSAVFMAISQAVFQRRLVVNMGRVPGLPSSELSRLLHIGATQLRGFIEGRVGEEVVELVVREYNRSLVQTFYAAVGISAASFVGAACVRWRSIKVKKVVPVKGMEKGPSVALA